MKTVLFSHEDDAKRALRQFEKNPVRQTFSAALAHQVLQAAQQCLTILQAHDAMQTYWRYTNPNVILFETASYCWSLVSADVHETVQYAFDDDKNAVKSAMLNGLNQANAIIRDMWFGFAPEDYALSRLLLYPRDKATATERYFSVLALSEGRDFPLFPAELPPAGTKKPSAEASGLNMLSRDFGAAPLASLSRETASLVSHYLDHRLD